MPISDDNAIERSSGRELTTRESRFLMVLPEHSSGADSAHGWPQMVQLLWRHKLLILCCGLLGFVGGTAYLIVSPPMYRVQTTLELQGINETFMNMNVVDPQAGTGNYSATQLNIQTQLRILESGLLRNAVHERLERESTPVVPAPSGPLATIKARLGLVETDPMKHLRSALGEAALSMRARAVTGTRILAISCEASNPEVASNYVNTLAQEYMSQNLQYRTGTTQRTTQWLTGQLEETKVRLEEAENRLQAFVRQSGSMFTGEQDTLANTKLRQLQGELAAIQADRIAKKTRYEMTLASKPESLPDVLEDANLRGYQQRITDLKREYALLTTTLTADYPKVKKVQAQINEMEVALRRETEAVVQRIKSEYDASVRREQLLSGSYAAQLGAVSNQSDKAVEYGLLKREVDILRQTLNSMLQQSNQASILTAAPTANVRVIDQARPPAEPFKPVPLSTGAYSVGIGLVSGAALSLLLESLRRHRNQSTFNLPGRSSQLLSVPELGVIPSSKVDPTLQFIWVSYSARRKTLRIPWPPRFVRRFMKKLRRRTDPSSRIELISWYRRGSMLAESFRSVFASLRLMDRRGRLPQVIVLSSPGPSEGKTTVITNLAIAMADSGRRVLLVDADCRRPRLHEVFDLNNDAGLSDLLVNPARLASDAAPPIQATQVPNLHLLAAGSLSGEELVHLLDSPNLLSLLGLLRQQFDVILVDTPPMLAFSEARLLGQHSDGMILLLRARSTHVETALAAKSRVLGDGTRLLGIVLNDWRPAGGSARYYCGPENYYHRQTSTVHP